MDNISAQEAIIQGSKEKGIENWYHQIMPYHYVQTISALTDPKVHISEPELIENINIIEDGGFCLHQCSSLDIPKEKIWGNENTTKFGTCHRAIDLTFIFNNTKFVLWNIARCHPETFNDIVTFVLSCEKQNKSQALKLVELINNCYTANARREKRIEVWNGNNVRVKKTKWEDLVLSSELEIRIKKDIENWIASEEYYKKLNIPYRRGYLFEGPPGNGKTAVARTIISSYDFNACSIQLSHPKTDDSTLSNMFVRATENAPSLVLLEDLDRFFPLDGHARTNITLSGLLNCLDGAADSDGVVVIATANHPENLDPAIRLRPGRFDVPVRFDNPGRQQREAYLKKLMNQSGLHANVSDEIFEYILEGTRGFSMAFIRSIYEYSITRSGNMECNDKSLTEAFQSVAGYYEKMQTGGERRTGFNIGKNEGFSNEAEQEDESKPSCVECEKTKKPFEDNSGFIRDEDYADGKDVNV